VVLKNDGLFAVCPEINCEYIYVDPPVGTEITAFSFTDGVLTITGTSLPTSNFSIEFAMVICTPQAGSTDTSILCDATNLVAGDYFPIIKTNDG
jgi:hypothetical protein